MSEDAELSGPDPLGEGLRERKKRLTRQLLSDTATVLFLERGFDGFKITDVAETCGVSEKTVYNYFPTKESLILDREGDMAAALRQALGPSASFQSPVQAILDVLDEQRRQMREGLTDLGGEEAGLAIFRRFMTMIDETPSLRAANGEMMDRLARVVAVSLAERARVSPDDPEPTAAAHALMGLADVQHRALRRTVRPDETAAEVYVRAERELRRAARLIDTGLWSFSATVADGGTREQLRTAAEAAQTAGRQVASALRQARKMWTQTKADAEGEPGGGLGSWGLDHPLDASSSREARQLWRDMQREHVQRWRESQREQAQAWREAARAMQQERRDAARQLKEELKSAHRVHQGDLRRDRGQERSS